MPTIYDSKAIIPAPFVSISQNILRSEGGEIAGRTWRLTLSGKLVADKGSPDSSGVFYTGSGYPPDENLLDNQRSGALMRKQSALRELFKEEGKILEISPWDGMPALKCNPRVIDIEFGEGPWVFVCDYKISFEADTLFGIKEEGFENYFLASFSEDWDMEPTNESRTVYKLTHRISAVGKKHYLEDGTSTNAWEEARRWCISRKGLVLDRLNCPGVLDGDFGAFDYSITQTVGEKSGSFGLVESWTCTKDKSNAIEEYTTSLKTGNDQRTSVVIEGTIRGLTSTGPNKSKYDNAKTKWAAVQGQLAGRALLLASVRTLAISSSEGHNEKEGVITYSREYLDKPECTIDPSAYDETISVSDRHPANVVASLGVLNRYTGPILQNTGSRTARFRTINITIRKAGTRKGHPNPTKPNTNAKVAEYMPAGSFVFVESDNEEFNYTEGIYNRSVTFLWQE